MIRLDATTRKLQILLGGAITTNQLPVSVCYSDKTSTTYNGGTTVSNTNSTTAVDICAAPAASTVRDIDSITVYNADTVNATATIRYNDNGTTYILFKATLSSGDQLIYTHGQGWKVLSATGTTKVSPTTISGMSGTKTEFDLACSDDNFAYLGTAQTFTQQQTFSNGAQVTGGLLGYGVGNGGTVTQATSKLTTVTLNKASGKITMHNASLAAGAIAAFVCNNNTVTQSSIISYSLGTTGPVEYYRIGVKVPGNGQIHFSLENTSGSPLADAVDINFNVFNGATS